MDEIKSGIDEIDQKIAFNDKLKKIRDSVSNAINRPGKKATELTNIEGSPDQIKFADNLEWHSKKEVDDYVKNDLKFTDEEWNIGWPSSGKSKAYDQVVNVISEFRNPSDPNLKPVIIDWNKEKNSGVWRMRKSENVTSKKSEIDYNISLEDEQQLPILNAQNIEEGYQSISQELLVSREKIIEILIALMSGRHVLLAGPIGTGKTTLAQKIPQIFWKRYGKYKAIDFTATSEWSTLDVVGGIMPKINEDDKPIYVWEKGCVTDTVLQNWNTDGNKWTRKIPDSDQPRGTWLIIDEFNRADIDKAFGQLFTSLRTRKLKIGTNKKDRIYDEITIPKDYRIIGTLNNSDKHFLFNLSDALKSRFAYIEVDSPSREYADREIYYSALNAIRELDLESSYKEIIFEHEKKRINSQESDKDLYDSFKKAYEILSIIRIFKKLGPAILKMIFQALIISKKIGISNDKSLDYAISSNIIPQIENESELVLGTIHAIFTDSLPDYMKKIYVSINKDSYTDIFEKILEFLDFTSKNEIIKKYEKRELPIENSKIWIEIENDWNKKRDELKINTDLYQWSESLNNLQKSKVM